MGGVAQPDAGVVGPRWFERAAVDGSLRIESGRFVEALQIEQRSRAQHLRRHAAAVGRVQRHRAHRAGIAPGAAVEVAVDHQPAADEGVDEQVEKTLHRAPAPGHQLGHAGGGGVLDQVHRQVGHGRHAFGQIDVVPAAGLVAGHAQQGLPAAQRQRCRHAHAGQPVAQRAQAGHAVVEHALQFGEQRDRIGEVVLHAEALAHRAGEVDHQHVHAAPADLDADRERAIRIERDRHRGLADPPAQRLALDQQAVVDQGVDDQRDRLRAQVGEPSQIGLGQLAVEADRLQHHALVVLAHADVVGAARP